MEQRKIQLSGRTTHVVSLPKKWIRSMHLEVGDTVTIDVADDASLRIVPHTEKRTPHKVVTLDADGKSGAQLMRLLLAAYQSGYGRIEVTAKERINPEQKGAFRDVIARTAGLEIVEERPQQVVLEDLVDPKQFASRQGIQRLRHIVSTMVRDALDAVKRQDLELAHDVEDRDDSVDRIYLMVSNQHVQLLGDLSLARKKQLTLRGSLFLMLVARALERCGDHAVRIAKTIEETMRSGATIDEQGWQRIDGLADESLGLLTDAVEAFLRGNADQAQDIIARSDEITAQRPELTWSLLGDDSENDMAAGLIVESLERLHQYAADIAEAALAESLVKAEVMAAKVGPTGSN